jgi:UDP-N-acetylmuramyl tripeptide synthase
VGLQKSAGKYLIEPDREKAIGLAFDEARAGDIVLLAGKGHEDYQILGDRTLPWDDRKVAQDALRIRGFDSPDTGEPEKGEGFGT